MITKNDLDFIALKEARIDFCEDEESVNESPIRRKLARISETAQTFTYYDLHKASADLRLSIEKGEKDLSPAIFKLKVHNLKTAMKNQLDEMKRQKKMIDEEIDFINKTLNMDEVEREYQLALHEKHKAEESNQNVGAETSV